MKILRQAGYAALAACVIAGGFFFYQHRQRNRITEKDKLILADFDNRTGDPVFDATLRKHSPSSWPSRRFCNWWGTTRSMPICAI